MASHAWNEPHASGWWLLVGRRCIRLLQRLPSSRFASRLLQAMVGTPLLLLPGNRACLLDVWGKSPHGKIVQTSEQCKCNGILHLGHANLRLACSHASINPPHTERLPSSALSSVLAKDQALHLALANGSFALANKYLGI